MAASRRPFLANESCEEGILLLPTLVAHSNHALCIMEPQTFDQALTNSFTVAPGVWGRKDAFVNYYMIQDEESGSWALVDAGLPWSASTIRNMAKELFGKGSRPEAIILTHGHFDHTGALKTLAAEWDVPVYAHPMEFPYLTGRSSYPPADPSVGGGVMSLTSFMLPTGPINVEGYVRKLPSDNTIPGFPQWKYIHSPGHTPGHISLFREADKVLIAGDAFATTMVESAFYAFTHISHLSGPPKFLTTNWASAKLSVMKLAALDPEIIASGHGKPMKGAEMRTELNNLSRHFDQLAVPAQGRYVNEPALANEDGVVSVPPATEKIPALVRFTGVALGLFSIGLLAYYAVRKMKKDSQSSNLFQLTS